LEGSSSEESPSESGLGGAIQGDTGVAGRSGEPGFVGVASGEPGAYVPANHSRAERVQSIAIEIATYSVTSQVAGPPKTHSTPIVPMTTVRPTRAARSRISVKTPSTTVAALSTANTMIE
jgi:hypothetical protein